uniref:Uncharacterized protein n=1 Tax=Sinocyclocheilus anshuiensis TaxID=1608454 RepID=A0A671RUV8_9TELE
ISKGRRSPRHRQRQNLSGSGSLRDKDRLISDGDAMYRKHTNSPLLFLYVPPQPTIEEARQRMHSLLDDAFALVSPSSQGSPAPLTFTGITAVTVASADTSGLVKSDWTVSWSWP